MSSIQTKLLSLVAVFLVGFFIYATVVHRTTADTLEQSDYRSVMDTKDVISDALPPPLFLSEGMVVALEAMRTTDKAELDRLHEAWKKLEAPLHERQAYWSDRLPPGAMRNALTDTLRRGAERALEAGDSQLWPALEAGDRARA